MAFENTDKQIHSTEFFQVVTFNDTSGTSGFTMRNPNEVDAYKGHRYARGFHANATGNLTIRPAECLLTSADNVDIYVVRGAYYPYSVGMFCTSAQGTSASLYGNIIAMR